MWKNEMMRKQIVWAMLVIAGAVALAGCGQTGPLRLPVGHSPHQAVCCKHQC